MKNLEDTFKIKPLRPASPSKEQPVLLLFQHFLPLSEFFDYLHLLLELFGYFSLAILAFCADGWLFAAYLGNDEHALLLVDARRVLRLVFRAFGRDVLQVADRFVGDARELEGPAQFHMALLHRFDALPLFFLSAFED